MKAKVALDTITEIKMVSLHANIMSITLAQLMRPVMGQNGSCARCAMSEANFFREMYFVGCLLSSYNAILYSRLFWQALKLANWSKNVIGEF